MEARVDQANTEGMRDHSRHARLRPDASAPRRPPRVRREAARKRKKRVARRLVKKHNEVLFLSLCHHNASKLFGKMDVALSVPVMLFPIIAASSVVVQMADECKGEFNLVAAVLGCLTTCIAALQRMLKLAQKQSDHSKMAMFYQEAKRDLEYFLAHDATYERCVAFEDMVNEKMNTLSLLASDVPGFVERRTDAQIAKELQRRKTRDEIMARGENVVVAISDSHQQRTSSDDRQSTKSSASPGGTPDAEGQVPLQQLSVQTGPTHKVPVFATSASDSEAVIAVRRHTSPAHGAKSPDAHSFMHTDKRVSRYVSGVESSDCATDSAAPWSSPVLPRTLKSLESAAAAISEDSCSPPAELWHHHHHHKLGHARTGTPLVHPQIVVQLDRGTSAHNSTENSSARPRCQSH